MRTLPKQTTLPTALLAIGLVTEVAGMLTEMPMARAGERSSAEQSISDRQLAAWVEQRVRTEASAADRRFDEISWAKDLCEAERLAKKHKRPIFLFTHDGRIALGRC